MKNLQAYFFEASKLFEFRVLLAGVDPKGEVMARIKDSINAYQVETIGKVKRLPIQEHRAFPGMGACEVYMFDVAVRYPTIVEQIRQLVIERGQIPAKAVIVYTKQQAEQQDILEEETEKSPILDNQELPSASSQDLVGEKRLSGLLKELESRKYEIAGNDKTDGKSLDASSIGNTSPVGSTQNKLPEPKSSAR